MKGSGFKVQGSGRAGFTLIELIIVLVIIGTAAGLVGIVVNRSSGSFALKSTAKDISTVLRFARNQAISEKRTYCLVVDSNERTYTVYTDEKQDNDGDKIIQVISKPIPEELQMTIKGSDEDSSFIEFFPVGNSTGGVIEVSNQKGMVYYVTINRITGKVESVKGEG